MSLSRQILVGLVLGVLTGVFFGERVAFLQIGADIYVKLLQMTVLPYVTVSLISGLGRLDLEQAKALGLKAGAVMVALWAIALGAVLLFPFTFPSVQTASFFSTTLIESREPFDLVALYIPSNPFYSLANNIVPAVVLFSVVLGIALIAVPAKQQLLDVLDVVNAAVSRANHLIARLTPIGIFAIAAAAAGTLAIEQLQRLEVYLIGYVAIALLISLWILPGLITAVTPLTYREVVGTMKDAVVTAFMTSNLFIVLPMLVEHSQTLMRRHGLAPRDTALPEVVVPASFNFPHVGKLLSLSFVLFAGWFADAVVPASDYARLASTGLVVLFGNINAAMPFLLDLFRIPADTFQLFLATSVVNARFGTLMAVAHTIVMALVGSWAIAGRLEIAAARLARYAVISLVLTVATVVGARALCAAAVSPTYRSGSDADGDAPAHGPRFREDCGGGRDCRADIDARSHSVRQCPARLLAGGRAAVRVRERTSGTGRVRRRDDAGPRRRAECDGRVRADPPSGAYVRSRRRGMRHHDRRHCRHREPSRRDPLLPSVHRRDHGVRRPR